MTNSKNAPKLRHVGGNQDLQLRNQLTKSIGQRPALVEALAAFYLNIELPQVKEEVVTPRKRLTEYLLGVYALCDQTSCGLGRAYF